MAGRGESPSSSSAIRMAAEGSPRVTKREPAQPEGFRWLRLSAHLRGQEGKDALLEVAERCQCRRPSLTRHRRQRRKSTACSCATIPDGPPDCCHPAVPAADGLRGSGVRRGLDRCRETEQAALRELKEETGYSEGVTVTKVTAGMPLDPGMSNSCAGVVFVEIDGDHPANLTQSPAPRTASTSCRSRCPSGPRNRARKDGERRIRDRRGGVVLRLRRASGRRRRGR